MKLSSYLSLLNKAEHTLGQSYRQVADGHGHEPDVHFLCEMLAKQCDAHERALAPLVERYGEDANADNEPERIHADGLRGTRSGPLGLLRDLQDLYILANFVECTWMVVKQACQALRDEEFLAVVSQCDPETTVQIAWLKTRMKQAAPQALVAAR
jgi:hypothetical protein